MEEHFPEYDEWRAAGEREREERRRDFEEIGDDPNLALLHALQTASDYFAGDDDEEGGTPSTPPRRRPALAPGAAAGSPLAPPPARGAPTRQVGRNDPCPCGSGKKFKKCCMRKQGGSLFG